MSSGIYDKLSEERKKLQEEGNMPLWWSTGGWQLFKEKYLYQAANPREQYERIARTLAVHTPDPEVWKDKFFDIMWKGWLSPSTPILANTGTTRGLPVSCAGSFIGDSIYDIYEAKRETAMLTKLGFGTSGYLGDIRARGTHITGGGKSSGVLPIIEGFQKDMEYVAQGSSRRGSWAGYLPIEHGDFFEVCTYLEQNPDGNNIGWNISDNFIEKLKSREEDALHRYKRALKVKMLTGKGYFLFNDKANAKRPTWYVEQGLDIKASNLCSEVLLHSDKDHTYTCVLASMNVEKYNEWKGTDAVYIAIWFLDCVAQEFIERAKNIKGLEKAVAFTKKGRALGLGQCGFHSYLQKNLIAFEEYEAHRLNIEIAKYIQEEAIKSSKDIASMYGEPEWMKGYGRANTHLLAIAPTKSTALIMGGISEGINPDTAMVFTQRSAGGEVDRINPYLLNIMKERNVNNKTTIEDIRDKMGSVQHVTWLSEKEKLVFKTAFEINQLTVLRLAALRGKYLDQWQSLNLFFQGGEEESYINEVHKEAFLNPDILGLYYVYSSAGVQASNDRSECLACQ